MTNKVTSATPTTLQAGWRRGARFPIIAGSSAGCVGSAQLPACPIGDAICSTAIGTVGTIVAAVYLSVAWPFDCLEDHIVALEDTVCISGDNRNPDARALAVPKRLNVHSGGS